MLSFLPRDMINVIVQYLLPDEYQLLYLSANKQLQNELKHCIVNCHRTIIADDLCKWFKKKHIKIKLKKQWTKCQDVERIYINGKLHSKNDEPAFIRTSYCKDRNFVYVEKNWYKHGILHRDNNKPAVMTSTGYCAWYVNGMKIKSALSGKFLKINDK
jgi:hypothetical protein